MKHLIIGAGVAGVTAAEELRKADKLAEITILNKEEYPLYSRVLLPRYVIGQVTREKCFLRKENWADELGIEEMRGVYAKAVDVKNKFVLTSNGRELPYDKLIITTGGEPKTADFDLRGVSYLRTIDDAYHLVQLLKEHGDANTAIYGNGFIACEYINIFKHFNIPTTAFFNEPHFWPFIIGADTGEFINNFLESNGVVILKDAKITELGGEFELNEIQTTTGKIKAQILGIGIGVFPEISFLKDSGIDSHIGICVDEFMKTNVDDIYVAGDVAEFYDVIVDRRLMACNWLNAQMQARVAVKNMLGEKTKFESCSVFSSHLLEMQIIFAGDVLRTCAEKIIQIGDVGSGGITEVFMRNERVVGAVIINRPQDRAALVELIKSKKAVSVKEIEKM